MRTSITWRCLPKPSIAIHPSSPFRRPLSLGGSSPLQPPGFTQWRTFAAATEVEDNTQDTSLEKNISSQQQQNGLPSPSSLPPPSPTETLVLNVDGMKCGGCSAAVKRILLQQPGVVGAAVNLLTDTAVVQLSKNEDDQNSNEIEIEAVKLAVAEALTSKGFPSQPRTLDQGLGETSQSLAEKKEQELKKSMRNLAFAWTLAAACCFHHLGHFLHAMGLHEFAHTGFLGALGNPAISGVLGAAALLGPGRPLLKDGALGLIRGTPNMNSLIALGATTSFGAGALTLVIPEFTLDPSFLEEPVMLLAFVLLGRSLEARARAAATSDLTALVSLLPSRARLVLDPGAPPKKSNDNTAAANTYSNKTSSSIEEQLFSVPTSTVRPGDVVRVLPGENIPVDGTILSGTASIDESMMTGESKLVAVQQGDTVTGGTIVYEAPLTIKATATGSSSTLAGIGRLVADAQSREAPVQRLADKVAGWFCYGVMSASAATFGFWSLIGTKWFPSVLEALEPSASASSMAMMDMQYGGYGEAMVQSAGAAIDATQAPWLLAVKLAVDVLVVACPCALGLATPTAVLVASSAGARRGLLLRGGDVLERAAAVDTVILDKTGTLTQGKLNLKTIHLSSNNNNDIEEENEMLRLAAAVESTTTHPLAAAVVSAALSRGLKVSAAAVQDASTVPGYGVTAIVDGGNRVAVGTRDWVAAQVGQGWGWETNSSDDVVAPSFEHPSSSSSIHNNINESLQETEVWVGSEKHGGVMGRLSLIDSLRPDAASMVETLKKDMGIKRILVLSGDQLKATQSAAAAAGIPPEDVYAGVDPEGKANFVRLLREQEGAVVAMVGDGINDAVALSAADVGIAMGGGADAAGEAAHIILPGDKLRQVPEALELGRMALGKIKQNLVLAVAYNSVGIPLAAGALLPGWGIALSPTVAAAMMAGSSIAVVTNSLLLRRKVDRMNDDK